MKKIVIISVITLVCCLATATGLYRVHTKQPEYHTNYTLKDYQTIRKQPLCIGDTSFNPLVPYVNSVVERDWMYLKNHKDTILVSPIVICLDSVTVK